MSGVIDRRYDSESSASENRKKFLDRHKDSVRKHIKKNIQDYDITKIPTQRKIVIKTKTTDEPTYEYESGTGDKRYVVSGNEERRKGDRIRKPQGQGKTGGTSGGAGEDEYTFELSKDELFHYLFEDMKLPDFIKNSLESEPTKRYERKGYTLEGMPGRLNVKKTMEQALARKIAYAGSIADRASQAETEKERDEILNKKISFLEETDLRYNRYEEEEFPVKKAVIVLLMDVSGSMSKEHKDLAKRFFLLLYLFLESEYETVELRFITYTHEAMEVSEEDFFYSKRTGGTSVLEGLALADDVLNEYDVSKTNLYLAHVSDGDIENYEIEYAVKGFRELLLPKLQYACYLQIHIPGYYTRGTGEFPTVADIYSTLAMEYDKVGWAHANSPESVFTALKGLFKDE